MNKMTNKNGWTKRGNKKNKEKLREWMDARIGKETDGQFVAWEEKEMGGKAHSTETNFSKHIFLNVPLATSAFRAPSIFTSTSSYA